MCGACSPQKYRIKLHLRERGLGLDRNQMVSRHDRFVSTHRVPRPVEIEQDW